MILGVAFFTVLERKMLRYVQTRKGPNKVGIAGIAQPLADAIKLFIKEKVMPYGSNRYIFLFSPVLRLVLGLVL